MTMQIDGSLGITFPDGSVQTTAATGGGGGTVTGVTATAPLASSGGTAPVISLPGIVTPAHGGTGTSGLTGLLYGNGSGAATAATALEVATVLGTQPVTSATNLAGGAANQIPFQTVAGSTSFIPAPTVAGTALEYNGTTFAWTSVSGTTANALTAGTGLVGTPGATFDGSVATTFDLDVTGVTAGTYGTNFGSVPTIAINAQGQITSATDTLINIDASQVTTGILVPAQGGTGHANAFSLRVLGGNWVLDQDVSISSAPVFSGANFSSNTIPSAALADTGVTAGTYGSAVDIPVITVNTEGQITSATTAISVALTYQGTWDASLNSPALADGIGNQGSYYVCNVAGTVNFGSGPLTFGIGDWVIYNGSVWQKIDNSQTTSVANFTITGITTNQLLLGGGSSPIYGAGFGTAGQVLTSAGVNLAPVWSTPTAVVDSFSGGTTGLTPASATTGAITLGGVLVPANGGTGVANTFTITVTGANQVLDQPVNSTAAPTFTGTNFTGIPASALLAGTVISPANGGTGVNNGANTLTLSGSYTLNQSVASGASPTFTGTNFSGTASSLTSGAATNVAGGLADQIPFQTAAGTTSFIAAPTVANTALEWNGAGFAWTAVTGTTANALTMDNSGTGAASGTTFDGSVAETISYNTIGASPLAGSTSLVTTGTITTGVWNGTAIDNAHLANSSVTINGNSVSLGGSTTVTATTPHTATFTTTGGGAAPQGFDGSFAVIVDYSTVGAPSATGTGASGTWGIGISGNAATASVASNVNGGNVGSLLYQSATSTTTVLPIGTAGQVLTVNPGATDPVWTTPTAVTPGGLTTEIQYNNAGAFAGSANFTFDGTTVTTVNDAIISGITVGQGLTPALNNTAIGVAALASATGAGNTAVGYLALAGTTGANNTAIGYESGINITTGGQNTIIGSYSGSGGAPMLPTDSNWIILSDGGGNVGMGILTDGGLFYIAQGGGFGTAGQVLTSGGTTSPAAWATPTTGTVTSVDGSGGTTGLTLTGGPITSTGTLTLGGTLAAANGGTGVSNSFNITVTGANQTLDQSVASGAAPTFTGTNFTAIPNGALTNSSVTFNGQTVALGASGTITANTTNALTAGTGLTPSPAGTFNGSAAVTFNLADTAVAPGTYGSAVTIPVLTIDQQGRITAATTAISPALVYQGTWDASTNTPTLVNGTGVQGNYWVANAAGTVNFGAGPVVFNIGDWAIYDGAVWQSVANSQTTSVANFTITGIAANEIVLGGGASPLYGLGYGVAGQVLTSGGAGLAPTWSAASAGSVTSVDVSGGTTGLTTSGGPITTAGTITLAGTLNVANGGTGATTLTGYVKGTGTTAMTASATIPTTDLSGTVTNAQLANSAITVNGTLIALGASGTITAATTAAATFDNSGTGAVSGTTFDGSTARTISYNTVGASPLAGSTSLVTVGTITTGTWNGTAIANANLANSSVTINGNSVSLGGSTTVTANTTNTLTIGTGLSGTSFNGSAAVTVAIANTAVTAASYGSASAVATFTVNAQGQLTAAATTPIAIANTQVSGLGTMSVQNANAVAVTGGTIDGTTIGGTTAAAITGTTITATNYVGVSGGTF